MTQSITHLDKPIFTLLSGYGTWMYAIREVSNYTGAEHERDLYVKWCAPTGISDPLISIYRVGSHPIETYCRNRWRGSAFWNEVIDDAIRYVRANWWELARSV